jgi:hypothetical protein
MIIGLTGKKGSGKDTVGSHLVNEYGFERAGFADLLKQAVAALFDVTVEQADQWKNEYVDVAVEDRYFGTGVATHSQQSWREMLQRFGTEMGRETFGPNFWVDQFWLKHGHEESLVITDVRFDNEAESIIKRDGFIFEIIRSNMDDVDTHASEAGINSKYITTTIRNQSSFDKLWDTVDELMGHVIFHD